MPVIKFRNNEELQEWKNAIESLQSIISLADQDAKLAKQFFNARLQTAQFWKRYTVERTSDNKLRQIASNDLNQLDTDSILLESVVPDSLKKMLAFLKQYELEH